MLKLDTHILLYALTGDLTRREASLLSGDAWSISAIVLWEISKLSELGRIEIDLEQPRTGPDARPDPNLAADPGSLSRDPDARLQGRPGRRNHRRHEPRAQAALTDA